MARGLLALVTAVPLVLCAGSTQDPQRSRQSAPMAGAESVRSIELPGIENAFLVGPRLISGGQPMGEQAFEALRQLGVRVIVSVDGARPDVETARRYGIRYIHLPVGYNGISPSTVTRLVKAATLTDGPIYVHCHHGKHRGPAAVGLLARALYGWNPQQVREWMEQAGTAAVYRGLYRDACQRPLPSPQELESLPDDLPEVAPVPPMVEAMVEVDIIWEHLRQVQRAGFAIPKEHPDLVPYREALRLAELLEALPRTAGAPQGDRRFATLSRASAEKLRALAQLLKVPPRQRSAHWQRTAREHMRQVRRLCSQCHDHYRNQRPVSERGPAGMR